MSDLNTLIKEKSIDNSTDNAADNADEGNSHHMAYPPVPPYYAYFDERENNPFMIPPPPLHEILPNDPYPLFGSSIASQNQKERTSIRPSDENIRELFQENNLNRKDALKRLIKSLLLNYIELLQILEKNPVDVLPDIPEAHFYMDEPPNTRSPIQWKMQQIHLILVNVYFLLNQYRPLQAKVELKRLLLQQQFEWKENIRIIDEFMKTYDKDFSEKYKQVVSKHDSFMHNIKTQGENFNSIDITTDRMDNIDRMNIDQSISTYLDQNDEFFDTSSLKKRKREGDDIYTYNETNIPHYSIPEHIASEFFS